MPKTYYWNDASNLGSGKKAIKRGDPLPGKYDTDPRLAGWIKTGVASLDEPSKAAEMQMTMEDLELKNMEFRDKIDSLTKQIEAASRVSSKTQVLSSQNAQLHKRIDEYSAAMMKNETKIGEAIAVLEKPVLPNVDKASLVLSLKSLEIIKEDL